MAMKLWQDNEGVAIYRVGNGAYTYETSYVSLDADGSPRAYHPQNKGVDANANAGHPNKGWRSLLAVHPQDPDKPYVQKDGPFAGYFGCKTSLRNRAIPETDGRAYVNSEEIPHLVFPGAFYSIKGTGRFGDIGMARAIGTAFETEVIVAEGGPTKAPLGEMSLARAVALGGANLRHPTPGPERALPRGLSNTWSSLGRLQTRRGPAASRISTLKRARCSAPRVAGPSCRSLSVQPQFLRGDKWVRSASHRESCGACTT
jgi:hypothetical protein